MSIFRSASVPCPKCRTPVEFRLVASVNADRRPDLRDQILAGTFQVEACGKCATKFRLPPNFTYIDIARSQWVLTQPGPNLATWGEFEETARDTFDRAFGSGAGDIAREIGNSMQPRIAFGWPSLSEKVLARDRGLDDVTLELLKVAVLRNVKDSPLSDENELRLVAADDKQLSLAWIVTPSEQVISTLDVPRALFEEIAAAPEAWAELRGELSDKLFVDYNRLLVDAA